MKSIDQDFRFAVRSLRKGFGVAVIAILCLTIGILANVTVFSIINGLFFRSLPYPEPDRLVLLGERPTGDPAAISTASPANFLDWELRQQAFTEMGAFLGKSFNVAANERPEAVGGAAVTPGFFSALGRQPFQGRLFHEDEAVAGSERVVVVSHDFWQSRLGREGEILGTQLRIDDQPHTVIGVLPEDFEFLQPNVHLWVPLVLDRGTASRDERSLIVVARLADGISMDTVRENMAAVAQRLEQEFPQANRGYELEVANLRHDIPSRSNRQVFLLMQGAMLFVLLIACANIGNLLLARGQTRQGEFAVRCVLGAGPWRIVRQLLAESLLLAFVGGTLGLLLGIAAVQAISSTMAASLPSFYAPTIDLRVVLFTAGLVVLAALLFGLAPAMVVRSNLVESIKQSGNAGERPQRRLISNIFVVAEIAVAMVLLGGAGMLLQSFLEVQTTRPGFNTERLLVSQVNLPEVRYGGRLEKLTFYRQFLDQLKSAPSVESAAWSSSVPRSPGSPMTSFIPDTMSPDDSQAPPRTIWVATTPAYATVLSVPVVRGRFLESRDREDTAPVAVVSESLARRYWPNTDVLGRSVTIHDTSRRIVGVVADIRQDMALGEGETGQTTVYLPASQSPLPNLQLLVHAASEPELVAAAIREALQVIDPELPTPTVQTFAEFQSQYLVGAQIFTALLGSFGSLALFLAALGVYGIVAYTVSRRTREIGVRMALGAAKQQVVRAMILRGLKLAGIGILIGLPGVVALRAVMESTLVGIVTPEFGSLVAAILILIGAVLLACWLPARRAAKVQPTVAFRL